MGSKQMEMSKEQNSEDSKKDIIHVPIGLDMTEAFMKLWNQAEKKRDDIQNRSGYQLMIRR